MKRLLLSSVLALSAGSVTAAEPVAMACGGVTVYEYYDWQGQQVKKPVKAVEKFNLVVDSTNSSMTVVDAAGQNTYQGVITIPSHYILDGNWPDADRANHIVTLFVNRVSGEYRLVAWTDRARTKEPVQSFSAQSQGFCQPNRHWK